ncbi:MAG TPA: TRAM domain-containing protein, partial [Thermoanaerobaculia bacterium]
MRGRQSGRGPGPGRGPGGPGKGRGGRRERGPAGRGPQERRPPRRHFEDRGPEDRRPPRRRTEEPTPEELRARRRQAEAFEYAKQVLEGKVPTPPPGARLIDFEEAVVRIEKLVAGGEGLARVMDVPVFVPRSAPGDLLRVRIVERRPDYGRAEIVEVLAPGPARRPDPVPELSRSSICDLQHLDDRVQPRLKAEAVRETLERLGKVPVPAGSPVIAGEPWGYRLRTQIHTEVDPVTRGVRVGYYARGTNDVIPLSRCPLLVPELEELLAELPQHLDPGSPRRLDLAAGDGGAVTVAPVVPGLPHGEVSTRVGEFTYAYDARTFFQSHRGLLPRLVETTVGPWEGETAVDLYAGVGLFSLPLARRYGRVTTVESDQIGARYARLNVRRNRVANAEVVNRVVESWLGELPQGVDRVVVDPPRGGLSREVRRALRTRRPARVTYVSCHPAALARDLGQLQDAYRV